MSYLFLKICFKENSLYYFYNKIKKFKKTIKKQKTFLVVFLSCFFLDFLGFFWVGFILPTLVPGERFSLRTRADKLRHRHRRLNASSPSAP